MPRKHCYANAFSTNEPETMEMEVDVNCAEACVNGCILGDKCPKKEYSTEASKFIEKTSLDKILDIAEEARRRKLTEPPKWIIPDFPE